MKQQLWRTIIALALCLTLGLSSFGASAEDAATVEPTGAAALTSESAEATAEATEPPATEAPAAAAPATDAPATDAPATAAPSAEPAGEATAEAPAESTAAPSKDEATSAPQATDESGAPICSDPNCRHIETDENGNDVALCALGRWMLKQESALSAQNVTLEQLMAAETETAVALTNGVTTLYRSGTYRVTGGNGKGSLVVRKNLVVVLALDGVDASAVEIGAKAVVRMGFEGENKIKKLTENGTLTLDGRGMVKVAELATADSIANADLYCIRGNIRLPGGVISMNDRLSYTYAVGDTDSYKLDDEPAQPFVSEQTDSGKAATFWLPEPANGNLYEGKPNGSTFEIKTQPEKDPDTEFNMDGDEEFAAEAGVSYKLVTAGSPKPHTLTVDKDDVTLSLNGVDFGDTASLVLQSPAKLTVKNGCAVKSIDADDALTISGSGLLKIGTLNADSLTCARALRLRCDDITGELTTNWRTVAADANLDAVTKLTYNGKSYPFAYKASATTLLAPLPAPEAGFRYSAKEDGGTLTLAQVPTDAKLLMLTDADIAITESGHYVIESAGGAAGGVSIAKGVTASITLQDARTAGTLALDASATVSLTLNGSNEFGSVTLVKSDKLTIGGSGALRADSITATGKNSTKINAKTNVSLATGTSVAGSSMKPTAISVKNNAGGAMANTPILIKLGADESFRTTTDSRGMVTFWRKSTLRKISVAVLEQTSGEYGGNTYATILTGAEGDPKELPVISGWQVTRTSADNTYITIASTNAGSVGVQYYVTGDNYAVPDGYGAQCVRVMADANGKAKLPVLETGKTVSFRVFACYKDGQTLNEATSDGFQFGAVDTFITAKRKYDLKDQTKDYDRKPFDIKEITQDKDPGSSYKITYYSKNKTALSAPPTDVGTYYARVEIPDDDEKYVAGLSGYIKLTIKKITVYIYPEFAFKIQGEKDPPYSYEYDQSAMLEGDAVTGRIYRVPGEAYGNYPYQLYMLKAPSYYSLELAPDAAMFFVDWGPHHYIPYDPLKVINPIHEKITFSDGVTLDMILHTVDKLNLSGVGYGSLITDTETRKAKPFTPSIRLRGGYDQAMLILQAEPEINKDGGYETDMDGNIQLRSRTLTLSPYMLYNFRRQHIRAIGFRLEGTMLTFELDDLEANAVGAATYGMQSTGMRYRFTLTPINGVADVTGQNDDAQRAAAFGNPMASVSITAESNGKVVDLTGALPSAKLLFDASDLLKEEQTQSQEISEVTIGRGGLPVNASASAQPAAAETPAAEATAEPAATDAAQGEPAEADASATDAPDGEAIVTVDTMELVERLATEKLKAYGTELDFYAALTETLDSRLVVPYTSSETETIPYTAVMQTKPYMATALNRSGLYGLNLYGKQP